MDKPAQQPAPATASTVHAGNLRVLYEKSPLCRVVHMDGAYGHLSITGRYIMIGIYSERAPAPATETYEPKENNLVRISDDPLEATIIREVEANLLLDIPTARAFHQWLGDRLTEHATIGAVIRREVEAAKKKNAPTP